MKPFDELVDLARRGERRLVEHIEPLLTCVRLLSARKMVLQSRGLDARLGQLLRCARSWSKTLDLVAFGFHSFPDDCQGSRLARTSDPIQANDLLSAHKDVIDHLALCRTQFGMAVFDRNPPRRRNQHRIAVIALIAALHPSDDLLLHANHLSGGVHRRSAPFDGANGNEFPTLHSLRKLVPHLFIGCLRHAPADRRLQDAPLILYRRSLEDVIAGIGNGLSFGPELSLVRARCMNLGLFACLGDNAVRLMTVPCCQFAVPL